MLWLPALRVAVLNVAVPVPSSATTPSVVDPSVKVTWPVGRLLPADPAVTSATRVTVPAYVEGFVQEKSVVLLVAGEICCTAAPDVLPPKLSLPA